MIAFFIQIVISVFIGICFLYLAKRYDKSQLKYFILGFSICFFVRIIYLLIYGAFVNFKMNEGYLNHKNYSIIISIFISYIVFTILRKRIKKKSIKSSGIDEIGKQ